MIINKDIIEIDLTLRCNLGCNNCDRMSPQIIDMKLESLEKFVNTNRQWKRIKLMGGEPTLYPYLQEAFKIFDTYKNKSKIQLLTNGYDKTLLKNIPSWIEIISSEKTSNVQYFKSFNVAPIDVGINKGFENGCIITQECGVSLSVDGLYYPCAAGATVAREFKMNIGKLNVDDVNNEMFKSLCPLCGHFKYKNLNDLIGRTYKQEYSKSWLNIFKKR